MLLCVIYGASNGVQCLNSDLFDFWDDEKIKLNYRISSTSTYPPKNYDDIYVK